MVLVLLLSFLPWIEIGCEGKADVGNQLGGMGDGQFKLTPPGLSGGKQIFATQSGFQVAAGTYSKAGVLTNLPAGVTVNESKGGQPGGGKDGPDAAPLVWLFFAGVIAAIAAGFALPPSRLRVVAVGSSVAVAVLILLVQALVLGFPAAKDVGKDTPANPAMGGPEMVTMFVRYTPWYWMSWGAMVCALFALVLEEKLAPSQPSVEPVLEVGDEEPPTSG